MFAVIVTVMVLELKAPDVPRFSALWPLWPTLVSYVVSYLFIAIIWIAHHYLMRFVGPPTLGLIWINFIHLFLVSLLPFATAWIARTVTVSFDGTESVTKMNREHGYDEDHAHRNAGIGVPSACRMLANADRVPALRERRHQVSRPRQQRPHAAHKSTTTSRVGCEQQTRTLPSAGLSSGSGP